MTWCFTLGRMEITWWYHEISQWGIDRNRGGLFVDLGRLSVDYHASGWSA